MFSHLTLFCSGIGLEDDAMQAAVQRYLKERRHLGFELTFAGTELMRFGRFADAMEHRGPLTQELQLRWAREHVRRTGPVTAAQRLEIVRPFAAYYRQFEAATEVPPLGILGRGHRRLAPHIYTEEEIRELLDQAGRLTPRGGLRPLMYRTLFGLIAAAGLRLSEALKLQITDVELNSATITVRQTKFHKSRCLPVHPSTVHAFSEYRLVRDRLGDPSAGAPFFISGTGGRLPVRTVENVFERMPLSPTCCHGNPSTNASNCARVSVTVFVSSAGQVNRPGSVVVPPTTRRCHAPRP